MSARTWSAPQVDQMTVAIERRQGTRHLCVREISCKAVVVGKEEKAPALLLDISTGGLRLVVRRRYDPDAILAISCGNPSDGSNLTLLAQVVYARNAGRGNLAVGCALINALTEEELTSLL
jgi:hypothetical protein